MDDDMLEDGIEMDVKHSAKDRRSKSFSGSPNAYLKSKTVTAFMRTELRYKERSFHQNGKKFEDTLKNFRKAISTPNLAELTREMTSERDINVVTELHLKRNDIMLKVIT